jgi:hypothetical protein
MPILPISLLFTYAPFPFVGLVLLYAINYLLEAYQLYYSTKWAEFSQKTLNSVDLLSSVAAIIAILLPYFAFYKAHLSVLRTQFFGTRLIGQPLSTVTETLVNYLITFGVEAGVFLILIRIISVDVYRENKRLFWLCFWMLLLIPLCESGAWQDFATRGSIPALTVLAVLTIQALIQSIRHYTLPKAILTLSLLALSWFTPLWLLLKAPSVGKAPLLRNGVITLGNPRVSPANNKEGLLSSLANFYSVNPQHKFFYRLLAKKQVPQ